MDKYSKLRAAIFNRYGGEDWHWHGKLNGSMTVYNVKTGAKRYFARIE